MEENTKYIRPSWDEYFLKLADTVASRATCDRGRSGCVIVRDRQILVTGYVGSPKGLPHCDEVGHMLKQTIHEDGSITTHCVRTVHAEQNAITQAASLGISLKGATLYCRNDTLPDLRNAYYQLWNYKSCVRTKIPCRWRNRSHV